MSDAPRSVKDLVEDLGGKVDSVVRLPDGSGFATASLPLPKDHWLTADPDGFNVPPMPFRMGTGDPRHKAWVEAIRRAGRYAVRCATMNGKDNDFDPDALVQNLVVGMLGYWTPNGLCSDDFANPTPVPVVFNGSVP